MALSNEAVAKKLDDLLREQKLTSLYTLTLERDRLFSVLYNAGLAVPLVGVSEFILVPGATSIILFPVPAGYVLLLADQTEWYTSLPWWLSYSFWIDTTAPALPVAAITRMPWHVTLDFKSIFPVRAFVIHQATNNHATQTAYAATKVVAAAITLDTWKMVKSVYLDPLLGELRRKAEELSGLQR